MLCLHCAGLYLHGFDIRIVMAARKECGHHRAVSNAGTGGRPEHDGCAFYYTAPP